MDDEEICKINVTTEHENWSNTHDHNPQVTNSPRATCTPDTTPAPSSSQSKKMRRLSQARRASTRWSTSANIVYKGTKIKTQGYHKFSWIIATYVLLSNVLGAGVLGTPSAFKRIGWWPGILSSVFLSLCTTYTTVLLARIKMQYKTAETLQDVATLALGKLGGSMVSIGAYGYIAGICVIMHLLGSLLLQELTDKLCLYTCGFIIIAIMIPIAQNKSLYEMTFLVALGVICMVVPIVMILASIEHQSGVVTGRKWPMEDNFMALMELVYAFTGQYILVEVMSEMKAPEHYLRVAVVTNFLFLTIYLCTACIGYSSLGEATASPITLNLAGDVRRWAASLILIHVVVCYGIQIFVLSKGVVERYFSTLLTTTADISSTPKEERSIRSLQALLQARAVWFWLTVAIICGSFALSNLLPHPQQLAALLGGTGGIMVTFTLPCTFAIKLLGNKLLPVEKTLCYIIGVGSFLFGLAGITGTIIHIATHPLTPPFSCLP